MTILYENIDPDGDVLIIIPYATGNCQSADEPEAIDESRAVVETDARAGPEASVEPKAPSEPVAADELVATNEPTSAEVDSVEESLSELRFKVSKKHLTIASQRARTMFKSKCKETQKSEVDGLYHWTIEPMFDPEALRIVLRIIHAQAQHLPNHVPLEMIVSIAEVADDLRCHEALSFFVEVWIDRLSQSVPNQMCSELVQWIFIASVFGLDEKFKQASRVAIMHSTGPIDVSGLPMRPEISERIEQKRQDLLYDLIEQLHAVLGNLCSGYSCRASQCGIMMLGALTKQMHITNLHSPRPERLFPNLSLSSTIAVVRRFDSPSLYLPLENVSHYSFVGSSSLSFGQLKQNIWVLQRDTFSSASRKKKNRGLLDIEDDESPSDAPNQVTIHSCRLQDLLKPKLDVLEARLLTLDLDCC